MDFSFNPLDFISIEFLSSLPNILIIGLLVSTAIFLYEFLRPWLSKTKDLTEYLDKKIGDTIMVKSQRLMDQQEVMLFNLLHLIIRDNYLLVAKVPFSILIHIIVQVDSDRRLLLKSIRNILVDFVLIHPGTLMPIKVIMIESEEENTNLSLLQKNMMEIILREVGMEIIYLNINAQDSPERLTELLGLKEEEQV